MQDNRSSLIPGAAEYPQRWLAEAEESALALQQLMRTIREYEEFSLRKKMKR